MARHRTSVDGIPVTTIPRTVIDLAGCLTRDRLESLVGQVVSTRRCSVEGLFDELDFVARRGRPGVRVLRSVLVARLEGRLVTESELERVGLRFLRSHGFDEPTLQFVPPWAGSAVGRVDMAFVSCRVVLEFDGRRWHDHDDQFERDRVRDQLALAAGWVVVRITWRQLHDDPSGVAERLRRIVESRTVG